jgi:DNA polymerase I-like protein with 3'-5' exonuclease and polymerase domains
MIITLDVENTVSNRGGKKQLDPFETGNTLVMVGYKEIGGVYRVYTFDHSEVQEDCAKNRADLQAVLDKTTLMIGHNISHDLMWLWESGFKYDGPVFDTMISDYVLQRGVKLPSDLGSVAMRHGCEVLKQDTLKTYFKNGYSTRDIPHAELVTYLEHDLGATEGIYKSIQAKLLTPEDAGLRETIDMSNEVAMVLARMYQTGIKVDLTALDAVRKEFENERDEIVKLLQSHVRTLMGDTPINLNSPEQLSWIVYSRKPHSKSAWMTAITPYMKDNEFKDAVKKHFSMIYKTKAMKCNDCDGKGFIFKRKKDGSPFKKSTKCVTCNGVGFEFKPTKELAGLKFTAPNAKWASANGFGTGKDNLETLERVAVSKGMTDAVEFLSKLRRLSALDSYLSTFVEGIASYTKDNKMIHVKLQQHITATGRFSGSSPNFQNFPRGSTFPVKKVFVSRWDGGKIMEADFAQLEFRVAAFLSQDAVAMKEVSEGFDVHSYTAKIISDAGQPTSRQDAKAHTFAPLYGATGYGRTPPEAAYYKHFLEKYTGIAKWHSVLAKQALNYKYIKIPSNREFAFPDVQRKRDGTVTHFTAIKNYPVQAFATADIVPLALVEIYNRLKPYKSRVVNSVHDSIVIDVHPDEIEEAVRVIDGVQRDLVGLINQKWSIDFNVPLALDSKMGDNWLEQKDVHVN